MIDLAGFSGGRQLAKDSVNVHPSGTGQHLNQLNCPLAQVSRHTQRMGGINAVDLSQDETTVLTIGQEKRVTYWNLREHQPVVAEVRKQYIPFAACWGGLHLFIFSRALEPSIPSIELLTLR